MIKILLVVLLSGTSYCLSAQELYVFTEPASNMPASSVSAKITGRYPNSKYNNYFKQRYQPEIMFGISKNIMVHASSTISDYYSYRLNLESGRLYAKWRFYSKDDIHRHFRLAAFAEGAYSNSPFLYGDINLEGDNSGVQGGLIATQLLNKLAISGTAAIIKVFSEIVQHSGHEGHSLEAFNYSLSAGYLLLPRNYTGYNQPNVNLYMEMLGMRGLKQKDFMLDLAPAVQLIISSNLKINAGYRFQVKGNMLRVGERSWQLSLERTFLGTLKNKPKR